MGVPRLVARLRPALSGHVLHVRPVPRLSQVDRGAGLGQLVEAASSAAVAASARLAEGRSTASSRGAQESQTTAPSSAQRQLKLLPAHVTSPTQ